MEIQSRYDKMDVKGGILRVHAHVQRSRKKLIETWVCMCGQTDKTYINIARIQTDRLIETYMLLADDSHGISNLFFFLKIEEFFAKFVLCCSRDWRFKVKAPKASSLFLVVTYGSYYCDI